jgi:Tol biopolymer transport system component
MGGRLGGALTGSKLWLYVVNADGSGRQRLTLCGACSTQANIAWSPDSRRIAFATRTRLDVFDLGSGAERVLNIPGAVSPAWSPDGTTIAFGDGSRVSTIRPDGSQHRTFADVGAWVGDVSWSPDGRSILFDSGARISTIGADGSNLRQLVSGPPISGPSQPSWSPDGRRILFLSSSPRGYFRVLVMRSDGSNQRIIYRAGCCVGVGSPSIWSPDGTQIAINLNGVVVMDLNGKHRHRTFRITTLAVWQPLPRTP